MREIKAKRRTNHKKGIAFAKKEQRRKEAEERNVKYQALTLEEKLSRNSTKVRTKLTKTA